MNQPHNQLQDFIESAHSLSTRFLAAEAREEKLRAALRTYRAIFAAWEGRDSITLSQEALQQWKSIADEALAEHES